MVKCKESGIKNDAEKDVQDYVSLNLLQVRLVYNKNWSQAKFVSACLTKRLRTKVPV